MTAMINHVFRSFSDMATITPPTVVWGWLIDFIKLWQSFSRLILRGAGEGGGVESIAMKQVGLVTKSVRQDGGLRVFRR